MDELNTTSVVHFYDTQSRRILCGARGPDERSTKHARSVSCPTCVGLMGTRPSAGSPARPEVAADQLLS